MSKPNSYFSRLRRRKVAVEVRKRPYVARTGQPEIVRLDQAIAQQAQRTLKTAQKPASEL